MARRVFTTNLNEVGIKCHGIEDNNVTDIASLGQLDPAITSVVVGLDTHVNYVKLSRAASYIRDRHCLYLATNTDASDQRKTVSSWARQVFLIPACDVGSMVSAVSAICGKRPDAVLGKPSRGFLEIVRSREPSLDSWDIMVVGDRLDTDVALAREVGDRGL